MRKAKKKKIRNWVLAIITIAFLVVIATFVLTYGVNYYRTYYSCRGVAVDVYRFPVMGIDVSAHQEDINWLEVYNANVKFAFIKATEGTDFVDKNFTTNWDEAKHNGIFVGAYHFFRFSKSGKEQAQNFIKNVHLKEMDMPPVLDVEMYENFVFTVSDKKVVSEIFIYLHEIEKHYKIKPIIYTNGDTYNRFIKGNFDDYDIWICKLCSEPVGLKWNFWQYSHRGSMPGIKSDVDMNTFNGSYSDLVKYIQSRNSCKAEF